LFGILILDEEMMAEQKSWLELGTCVSPEGRFVYGLHEPHFKTVNLRESDVILPLGETPTGRSIENRGNFPPGDVDEACADPIFEIANAFPFRGTTFIGKGWADATATDPTRISIASPAKVSMEHAAKKIVGADSEKIRSFFAELPEPIRLALATTSTDPNDLRHLAQTACRFIFDDHTGLPTAVAFAMDEKGRMKPQIYNHRLYEAVANSPYLDDVYKAVMVLNPGIQGQSEIVGEWSRPPSHVFEYLRRNSYIPWGHYAANMAHDCVRYSVGDITAEDIRGMRHLYYQRTYIRLGQELDIDPPAPRKMLSVTALEQLRGTIVAELKNTPSLGFTATLWGWNYGFDYAPTGFRLHASHQQIHQQFALIPDKVPVKGSDTLSSMPAYACGDRVHRFITRYRDHTGQRFFDSYEQAIRSNQRMDGRTTGPSSLVVHEDDNVMLFVPKAQTSQWELQLMPLKPVGNVLAADSAMRQSIDRSMLVAMRVLTRLGATMITVIEYSGRFNLQENDQRMVYAFLPRLPESPGAFSEAQLRWINGHYPEDFALACRLRLEQVLEDW
jgi:hypothetical protein